MLENLKALLKMKNFWMAVLAVLTIFIKAMFPTLPVTDADVSRIFIVLITLIFGVNFSEVASELRKNNAVMKDMLKK